METNNPLRNGNPPHPMLFLILAFLLGWGLGGCGGWYIKFSTPDVPPAPCPIQELLLDASVFPGDDWEETGSRSAREAPVRMGIGRIGTSFSESIDGAFIDGAIQEVYRFEDERQAGKAYKDSADSWFTLAVNRTKWTIPEEMNDLAVNADQYRVGCNNHKLGDLEECQYIAQYGPYAILFLGGMRSLSYEDFIELVREVDQRAIGCLERNPSSQ